MNTLYVLTQGTRVSKDQKNIVVRKEVDELLRLPMHHVSSIVTFGLVRVTPGLMGECLEQGIELSFMSLTGRFLGRLDGITASGSSLRRVQYRLAGTPESLPLAVSMIRGKIENQRAVLFRQARECEHYELANLCTEAASKLGRVADRLALVRELSSLLAVEGEAARAYIGILGKLPKNPFFHFTERSRRPPRDPGNTILSFYYSLLLADCLSAIRSTGLDPGVGLIHGERSGKPSLALDLMEEFRAPFADRAFLSAINLGILKTEDIQALEGGAFKLTETGRKKAVTHYRERKEETVQHPAVTSSVSLKQLPHIQATLIAKAFREGLSRYEPYRIR